jgi:hypothetical protein
VPVLTIGARSSLTLHLETLPDGHFVMAIRDVLNEFELRVALRPGEVVAIEGEWAMAAARARAHGVGRDARDSIRQVMIVRPDDLVDGLAADHEEEAT